jgi:hypothetical protein
MSIGKLENVPLRELWKHEQRGFSAWLENNLEALAEAIGISLTQVEREKDAGSFSVDLVADDQNGNLVVIESQLEATDHDHLGKLLTYLTNIEAKTAIWIAKNPRPEHIRAVAWLNEATPADIAFYLVRVAAYRIAGSDPAPLFTVIVAPTQEAKNLGREKGHLAERHVLRLKFWDQLLARAKAKGFSLHASISPSAYSWIGAGAGKSGLSFNYVAWLEQKTAAELYIDTGDRDENKRIFDALYAKKENIEASFGGPLMWDRLDDRRASRIRMILNEGGLKDDESKWASIQDSTIDAMDRLSKALKPHLRALHD